MKNRAWSELVALGSGAVVAPQSSSSPTHSSEWCPEDPSHHSFVPPSSTGYNPEVEGGLAGQDGLSAPS